MRGDAVNLQIFKNDKHLYDDARAGFQRPLQLDVHFNFLEAEPCSAARSRAYCQALADFTGRTVWTCPVVETAAMGAAVQATVVLENTRVDAVTSAWAPQLEFAADPNPHMVEAAQAARNAYRAAAARVLDKNENSPNRRKT